VLDDLQPIGQVETVIAERVALQLWKLGRVARYERDLMTFAVQDAEKDVGDSERSLLDADIDAWTKAKIRLRRAEEDLETVNGLVDKPGPKRVNEDLAVLLLQRMAAICAVDLYDADDVQFPGWPEGSGLRDIRWNGEFLVQCLGVIGEQAGHNLATTLRRATAECEARIIDARDVLEDLGLQSARLRQLRRIPNDSSLNNLARYETHLERSLSRNLHELRSLQRAGRTSPSGTRGEKC
jgi:hypothetical protein